MNAPDASYGKKEEDAGLSRFDSPVAADLWALAEDSKNPQLLTALRRDIRSAAYDALSDPALIRAKRRHHDSSSAGMMRALVRELDAPDASAEQDIDAYRMSEISDELVPESIAVREMERKIEQIDPDYLRLTRLIARDDPKRALQVMMAALLATTDDVIRGDIVKFGMHPESAPVFQAYAELEYQTGRTHRALREVLHPILTVPGARATELPIVTHFGYAQEQRRRGNVIMRAVLEIAREAEANPLDRAHAEAAYALACKSLGRESEHLRVTRDVVALLPGHVVSSLDLNLLSTVAMSEGVLVEDVDRKPEYEELKKRLLEGINVRFQKKEPITEYALPYMRRVPTFVHYATCGEGEERELVGSLTVSHLPGGFCYVDQVAADPHSSISGLTMAVMSTTMRYVTQGQGTITVAAPGGRMFETFIEQGAVAFATSAKDEYRGNYLWCRWTKDEYGYVSKMLKQSQIQQLWDRCDEPYRSVTVPMNGKDLTAMRVVIEGEPKVYGAQESDPEWEVYRQMDLLCTDGKRVLTRFIPGPNNDMSKREYLCIFEDSVLDDSSKTRVDDARKEITSLRLSSTR